MVRAVAIVVLVPAGAVAIPAAAGAAVADAPAPATNLKATVVDLDAVKLSWDNPTDVNLAETVIRGKEGATAPTSKDDGFAVTPDGSLLPSATASALPDPNVPYTFGVFACSATGECAAPATVTVDSYVVTASAAQDRVVYGRDVKVTGRVVSALTGAPAEYIQISAVDLPVAKPDDAYLLAQDLTRTGGNYVMAAAPSEYAHIGILAMSDATHLGGFGLTRPVHVSAYVLLLPKANKRKGPLGTTFALVGGAVPDSTLPVVLQELVKGKWRTLVKQKLNKNGVTVFKVKPATRGKHLYRATRGAIPGVSSGRSAQVTITVT